MNASIKVCQGTPSMFGGSFTRWLMCVTVFTAGMFIVSRGCGGGGGWQVSPVINLSQAVLIFSAEESGPDPTSQTFDITNGAGGTLNWTAGANASWLMASPVSGDTTTETDTLTVSVDIAGRTVGTYTGSVTVSDPAAGNDPQTVEVFLIVASSTPVTDFLFTDRPFKTGVGPIPRNFPGSEAADWLDMYEKVPLVAELMAVQGDWRDSVATSGQIPEGLNALLFFKDTYNYEPVPAINFFQGDGVPILDTPDDPTNDWTNADVQALYEQVALDIIQTYNVNYMGLAIEVNTYWQFQPADFDRFVAAYQQMYANIKAAHPNVKLFVSFQLEMMKGIGDINFGMDIDPHWNLLDQFGDMLDVVAFTTYPGIEFATVADIPEDYYLEIRKYTDKPVLFTEIGWASTMGGEQAQVDFILKFFRLSEGLNKELLTWAFMHDLVTPPPGPLNRIGLRNSDGTAKQSWSWWQTLKAMPYTGP